MSDFRRQSVQSGILYTSVRYWMQVSSEAMNDEGLTLEISVLKLFTLHDQFTLSTRLIILNYPEEPDSLKFATKKKKKNEKKQQKSCNLQEVNVRSHNIFLILVFFFFSPKFF